ncbi:38402_t:CDS:2 [Gigaspora margarita]|uniref:38402_t:CDS:1 n=1 Tax=Gigaspora margarita TaxID=4874 RepID=A0ABM8W425_GIGMA|nr:38402_t:CDS:2 [Gigaspora margarita]
MPKDSSASGWTTQHASGIPYIKFIPSHIYKAIAFLLGSSYTVFARLALYAAKSPHQEHHQEPQYRGNDVVSEKLDNF